ncbi:MAG: arsenite transporter [Thiomicrorhabdus sp.]|nr:MAG: arsenite transporter [Thiomicrorhabdus sp.]
MSRGQLEKNQIWIYTLSLGFGLYIGLVNPNIGTSLEVLISPILAALLYSMFTLVPFLKLREAFSNIRFNAALFTINFIIAPILVWLLSLFLPEDPVLLLGFYLVLLTPCIDYVIVFTHMGKGDSKLLLASTPLLLIAQIIFLPIYLWLFMGDVVTHVMSAAPFIEAFFLLIALPLVLAFITELWAKKQSIGVTWLNGITWLPVPLMAFVLFFVVASQIGRVEEELSMVWLVIPVYVAFMVIMPLLAKLTACAFHLNVGAGRALLFSAGTRNSLVVLPLALALPEGWILAAAIIVTQTMVELVGELFYIRLIPSIYPRRKIKSRN